ncbi:branched-chain amino acid ABC transporter permease [Chloroflexota bacterium]
MEVSALVIAQAMVNSLMMGAVYTLIALGLNFIFGILRIVQFAHGQIYMMAGFAVFIFCTQFGLNYFVALLLATVVVSLGSLVLERVFFRPFIGQLMPSMIVGVGLMLVFEGIFQARFGSRSNFIESPLPGVVNIAGITVQESRLLVLGVSACLIVAVFWYLRNTKAGQAMRAVSFNEDAATLQGINANRIRALGFAIGSGLAALAGGLMLIVQYVDPFVGTPMMIKGLIIIMVGGLGSLSGAVVGAFTLGLIDSLGFTFIGSGALLFSYILVIVILIFRPKGVLGRGQ